MMSQEKLFYGWKGMMSFCIFILPILIFSGCNGSQSFTEAPIQTPEGEKSIENKSTLIPVMSTTAENPQPSEVTYNPVSLQAFMEKSITGSDLRLESTEAENAAYIRYGISYRANGLKISGIMNLPKGNGPFPLLILNHGYIDPAVYTRGRGLKREQDFLARQGFAVVHPDYRNHAFSDKDPEANVDLRLGYVEDVIGAILAVQMSELPELESVDTENVGMLGHSMGGGIAQKIAVTRPDLVDAFVFYAPVSGDEAENFSHYIAKDAARSGLVKEIETKHGLPASVPDFWRGVSPQNFYDRISSPILIFIGTKDESTPPEWSREIARRLESAGKRVELVVYENERHEFGPQWGNFMNRSAEFFKQHLTPSTGSE